MAADLFRKLRKELEKQFGEEGEEEMEPWSPSNVLRRYGRANVDRAMTSSAAFGDDDDGSDADVFCSGKIRAFGPQVWDSNPAMGESFRRRLRRLSRKGYLGCGVSWRESRTQIS